MDMEQQYTLERARAYEQAADQRISPEQRPAYHLSPMAGWMNDPNGFSWYRGQYHLFYQYHPFRTRWAAMHWGHAVSDDLVSWRYLPAAMAPDQPYDAMGCFSGTAATLPDGRQLLLYTGVHLDGEHKERQGQCVAIGDGLNYEKIPQNPVLSEDGLPEELSPYDFRDPRIWRTERGFRCVVGACTRQGRMGVILQYESDDGIHWRFLGELARNDGSHGRMWECPDFFPLDGRWVLSVSPQDMLAVPYRYASGNGTVCMIGDLNEDGTRFIPDTDQPVDYGMDFYAPQTLVTPDGRTVMIAWMQNWDTVNHDDEPHIPWHNQMTVAREIRVRDGRLIQRPVRELERLRADPLERRDLRVRGDLSLPGQRGRVADLTVRVRAAEEDKPCPGFALKVAESADFFTEIRYQDGVLTLDRAYSGTRRNFSHQRSCRVREVDGAIQLRVLIDRFSVEAFVNDGEQALTAVVRTDPAADGIALWTAGDALVDIQKYALTR